MPSESIGLIQVDGLAAAHVVADTGLKAADVRLVGLERVNGGMLILVKFAGDVSGVQAAVEVGLRTAQNAGAHAIGHVIARPAAGISALITPSQDKKRKKKQNEDKTKGTQISVQDKNKNK